MTVDAGVSDDGPAEHPSPDDVVVRGGVMNAAILDRQARAYEQLHPGQYAISVWTFPGMDADEIARRVAEVCDGARPDAKILNNSMMRKARAGEIEAATFRLQRTGTLDGHHSLFTPGEPTPEHWQALDGIFDAPQNNPVGGR